MSTTSQITTIDGAASLPQFIYTLGVSGAWYAYVNVDVYDFLS